MSDALCPIPARGLACDACGAEMTLIPERRGLTLACPVHGSAPWMARPRHAPIASRPAPLERPCSECGRLLGGRHRVTCSDVCGVARDRRRTTEQVAARRAERLRRQVARRAALTRSRTHGQAKAAARERAA